MVIRTSEFEDDEENLTINESLQQLERNQQALNVALTISNGEATEDVLAIYNKQQEELDDIYQHAKRLKFKKSMRPSAAEFFKNFDEQNEYLQTLHDKLVTGWRQEFTDTTVMFPSSIPDEEKTELASTSAKEKRVVPTPLPAYDSQVAEVKALTQEVEKICQQEKQALYGLSFMADTIKTQFIDYIDLTQQDLSEEQYKRLKKELAVNPWFTKLDAINKSKEQRQRLTKITQQLRTLRSQMESNNRDTVEGLKPDFEYFDTIDLTLKDIEHTEKNWTKQIDDKLLNQLTEQQKRLQKWVKSAKTPSAEPHKISQWLKDRAFTTIEKRTAGALFLEIQDFTKSKFVPAAKSFENTAKEQAKAIRGAISNLEKIQSNIKTAVSVEDLTRLEASIVKQELSEVSQVHKEFKDNTFIYDKLVTGYTEAAKKAGADVTEENSKLAKKSGLNAAMVWLTPFVSLKAHTGREHEKLPNEAQLNFFIALIEKAKDELKSKRAELQQRKIKAKEFVKGAWDFIAEIPQTKSTLLMDFENLVNEIKQEDDLTKALELFNSLPKKLATLQSNKIIPIRQKVEEYRKKITEIHSDDISETYKDMVLKEIALYMEKLEQLEGEHQQQIDMQVVKLAPYLEQAGALIEEKLKKELPVLQQKQVEYQQKYTKFDEEYTELSLAKLTDINSVVPISQQNEERIRLKDFAANLSVATSTQDRQKNLLALSQECAVQGKFDNTSIKALLIKAEDQAEQLHDLESMVSYELKQVTNTQTNTAENTLNELEISFSKLQNEVKLSLDEATRLGGYYFVTNDVSIKNLASWQEQMNIARAKLPEMQELQARLQSLSDLEQLPVKLSKGISLVSLADRQKMLSRSLCGVQVKLTQVAQGDFVSLIDARQLEIEARKIEPTTNVPNSIRLRLDDEALEDFAWQQANNAEQLANNIIEMDKQLFTAIPQQEFKNFANSNDQHYKKITDISNKLSGYVKTSILKCSQLDERTLTMERWVLVMQKCRDSADYQGLAAIYRAFSDEDIARLKSTKAGLSQTAQIVLADVNSLFSVDGNYHVLRQEMEHRHTVVPYLEPYHTTLNLITMQKEELKKSELIGNVVMLLSNMQDKHSRITAVANPMQAQLQFLESKNDTPEKLKIRSLQCEPKGSFPAPSSLLHVSGDTLWRYSNNVKEAKANVFTQLENPVLTQLIIDNRLRINPRATVADLQRINEAIDRPTSDFVLNKQLQKVGLRFTSKQRQQINAKNKQIRYHKMIVNPVLAEIVKDKNLKSTTAGKLLGKSTVSVIKAINKEDGLHDNRLHQLLDKLGIQVTEEQFQAIQRHYRPVNPEIAFDAKRDLEKTKSPPNLEKPPLQEAIKTEKSVDINALHAFVKRVEDSLKSPWLAEDELYKLYRAKPEHAQDTLVSLQNDSDSLGKLLQNLGHESKDVAALHTRATAIQDTIKEIQRLITEVIPATVIVTRDVRDKLIITTDRNGLSQALQKPVEAYLIEDKVKGEVVDEFFQADKNTVYYATPTTTGATTEREQQLQQLITHQLFGNEQTKLAAVMQPSPRAIYLYGPPVAARAMAQKLYQKLSPNLKAQLKILVNDTYVPPSAVAKKLGFFEKDFSKTIRPVAQFRVFKKDEVDMLRPRKNFNLTKDSL